jgi:hypothetical protein
VCFEGYIVLAIYYLPRLLRAFVGEIEALQPFRPKSLHLSSQKSIYRIVMAGKLRGKSLSLVIGLIGAVGFVLQGYDQAVCNGLLTLGSFIAVFPQIDTVNTTGNQNSHNSTIQGMC